MNRQDSGTRVSDREAVPPGDPVDDPRPATAPSDEPLTGVAVTVRPPRPAEDAAPLHAVSHGDDAAARVWTFMPYGPFPDAGAMRAWLAECVSSTDPLFRVVVDNASGLPVGMASYLNIVAAHRRVELGHIWYAPRMQRTRVNTETIYLMLGHSFDVLGCRRVEWKCNALNARSRAAALRLGFRFEGVFRQHMIVKGRNRDTAWYALVDADWPAVAANMERWLYGDGGGDVSLAELNAPVVAGFHDPLGSD